MRTLRPHMRIAMLLCVAMSLFATAAIAQTDTDVSVETAIQRNAELLAEATHLVSESNSAKARASLQAATMLHEQSVKFLQAGDRRSASAAAHRARQAILNTISIAKSDSRIEESAHKAIERAAARLLQARAAWDESGRPEDAAARKLIEDAHELLQRARDGLQEHMFSVALQLANSSLEMSNRALRMLRRDLIDAEDVLREIEQTDAMIDRVASSDRLQGSVAAERALGEARDLQNRARTSARAENYRLALEQTRRARDIALRLLRSTGGKAAPDAESVERAIAFTDEIINQAYDIARSHGAGPVVERLDGAARIQQEARDRFAKSQLRAASELTFRARDAARKALTTIDRPVDADVVRRALAETNTAIARARDIVGVGGNETARALLLRAVARQDEAQASFDRGDFRRALALTRIARNLAARAARNGGNEEI